MIARVASVFPRALIRAGSSLLAAGGRLVKRFFVLFALIGVMVASTAAQAPAATGFRSDQSVNDNSMQAESVYQATDGVARTELDARMESAASGQSVEVLAFRDESRDVVANPDGTLTVRQYVTPIRTLDAGVWVDVDPTLGVRADGRLQPRASTTGVSFSGGGTGSLITVTEAGRMLSVGWDGVLPTPTLDGATATYREVLPDVDLTVTALIDGFSHTLVVKSAAAATSSALAAIQLPLHMEGTDVRVTPGGGVEVIDVGSGGVMLAADTPMMWDSGGTVDATTASATGDDPQQRAEVHIATDGDVLTLTPDMAVLTGANTTYPVYIDPVYRDESRTAWAMVDSGFPSEEYWKFDGGDNEGLGRCPVDSGTCNGAIVKRLFYRMPTSFYDGKEILSAEFVAVLKHNWASANVADQANLYRISSGFTTTTNWSNQPSASLIATASPPAPSGDCSGLDDGGVEWDVAPELQAAADAGSNTLTFGLRNATESDSSKWMRFCDSAYLRVRYNTAPSQPKIADLSISPGAGCTYTLSGESFISRLPTLRAFLYDPDHGRTNEWNGGGTVAEQVRAEFRIMWGTSSHWTAPLTAAKSSGSRFTLDLATASGRPSLPINSPISWIVRAYDGHHHSSWSNAGEANPCRFVVDPTAPNPPTISSTDFPPDGTWVDMLGESGTFTLASASADVASYTYDFTNDADGPVSVGAGGDGTATVPFIPSRLGPHVLTVQAFDNAANSSINSYDFAISSRGPVGSWGLADPAGSSQAIDATGANPAAAGPDVTFGVPGPGANTAVRLDGSVGGWLQAAEPFLGETGDGFAVSAWVRLTDLSQNRTVVDVQNSSRRGFALRYAASSQAWVFATYSLNPFEVGGTTVSNNMVSVGEWLHLVAVREPGMMRLYVNGVAPDAGPRPLSGGWSGLGTVHIGRSVAATGSFDDHWAGDLAEVQLFDRVVFADEVAQLSTLAPTRRGYWQLNDAESGASPEHGGGSALALNGGAAIYQPTDPLFDPEPLLGAGHLELDGVNDYAAAPVPVVDTGDSFTVTARVRLPAAEPDQSMAVVSVPGAHANAFTVRYSAALAAWELVVASADTAGSATISIASAVTPSAGPEDQVVAVVYSAFSNQITLYVDGMAAEPLAFDDPWVATGALQVGRSRVGSGFGDYLSGAVDDVRVYTGVADAATIQRIGDQIEQPEL